MKAISAFIYRTFFLRFTTVTFLKVFCGPLDPSSDWVLPHRWPSGQMNDTMNEWRGSSGPDRDRGRRWGERAMTLSSARTKTNGLKVATALLTCVWVCVSVCACVTLWHPAVAQTSGYMGGDTQQLTGGHDTGGCLGWRQECSDPQRSASWMVTTLIRLPLCVWLCVCVSWWVNLGEVFMHSCMLCVRKLLQVWECGTALVALWRFAGARPKRL